MAANVNRTTERHVGALNVHEAAAPTDALELGAAAELVLEDEGHGRHALPVE